MKATKRARAGQRGRRRQGQEVAKWQSQHNMAREEQASGLSSTIGSQSEGGPSYCKKSEVQAGRERSPGAPGGGALVGAKDPRSHV